MLVSYDTIYQRLKVDIVDDAIVPDNYEANIESDSQTPNQISGASLNICQTIAKKSGGDILVNAPSDSKGNSITFSINMI